jgi:two-component system, NarL family, sensor histidine kinase DegS
MVEKVLFETFQECLQNVVKHSRAEHVDILLSYQAKHVLLRVKDDGLGFSLMDAMIKAKHEPHYGILTMNEQAKKLGATLHIETSIGKGTEIKLIIPNLELGEGSIYDSHSISG